MYLAIPPAYGYPDDGEERPPFVLMEPYAYFATRRNATTATCKMRGFKGDFKVTFCTARAPLVSYMCFDATAYDHTAFAVEPQILAAETDGSLVLLRVVFGDHPSAVMFPHNREYLVYDASGPSVQHLPHPGGIRFSDDSIAFVRPDDGINSSYVLAATSGGIQEARPSELYTYHSDTATWGTKKMVLKPSSSNPVLYHSTSKAITIGGGTSIAWVDLWQNIILCDDVLAERPTLHSLQLPPPMPDDNDGNPRCLRDIALLDDGSFRYVEMQFHVHSGSRPATGHWEVTVWSNTTSASSSSSVKDWVMDHQLKFTDIPEASLPELRVDPGRERPTLSTLHTGMPRLSLQDDGIVYFLSKVFHNDNDHVAWVLAIDMRNKTIHKVDEFCPARTLGLAEGYDTTRISKYLKGTKQNYSETL